MPQPPVPETLEQLTPQWLSSALGFTVVKDNFTVTPNVQAGSGFLSHVVRVSCETADHQILQLIIKLLPEDKEIDGNNLRQLVIHEKFDVTEIAFYETMLPRMLVESPTLEKHFCKFYTGYVIEEPKRDSVLIMADMKPLGYSTYGFSKEIEWSQLKDAVKFMAEFHFTADAIVFKEKKSLREIWPVLKEDLTLEKYKESGISLMCLNGYDNLDSFLEKQKASQSLRDYYMQLQERKEEIFPHIFLTKQSRRSLIHNDLWANNMLVPDQEDMPMKIIDWQIIGVGNPANDLAVLLISAMPQDQLNRKRVEELLDLYLDVYESISKKRNLPDLMLDRNEFKKFFFTYGMAHIFTWFVFTVYPFAANFPRLINAYEFLKNEVDVVGFLLGLAGSYDSSQGA